VKITASGGVLNFKADKKYKHSFVDNGYRKAGNEIIKN
jgi:hypothetical protein